MPRETSASRKIVQALKEANLDPVRVENRVGPGTPDINYINGWIETKSVNKWPVGKNTPLRIPHYTFEQKRWHRNRIRFGGHVWVVLRVGSKEWFVFDGNNAALFLGQSCKEELISKSYRYWPNGFNQKEFIECLTT